MFPAFKEWRAIVEALGSGEQIVILRKGGISEKRGGFSVDTKRFWLFPTQFHAQREKTKPSSALWFEAPAACLESPVAGDAITLRYFADVVHHLFLGDWTTVAALSPHHYWTEEAVREKFDWSQPPGLHAVLVRVHRLREPIHLPLTPAMGGCKSWIELPCAFDAFPASPVLDTPAFNLRRSALGL